MALIDNRTLNDLCTMIVGKTEDLYPRTNACFQMLFLFGFRWIEIFELNRWRIEPRDLYVCNTAKKSNDRYIDSREMPELYKSMILLGDDKVAEFGYMSMIRYFTRFSWYPKMYLGKKEISLHVFRHNRARQLKEKGWKDKDIALYFGEIDQKNMDLYIYSKIYDGL